MNDNNVLPIVYMTHVDLTLNYALYLSVFRSVDTNDVNAITTIRRNSISRLINPQSVRRYQYQVLRLLIARFVALL